MDILSYILALKNAKSYTDEQIKAKSILVKGYYNTSNGLFYEDSSFTTVIVGNSSLIYLDLLTETLWEYTNSTYYQLVESVTEAIVAGYYLNGEFYTDTTYTEKLEHNNTRFYIDISTFNIYKYNGDGVGYALFVSIPQATPTTSGIMKLYNELGDNDDGTITQNITTQAFSTKLSLESYSDEELVLTFDTIL